MRRGRGRGMRGGPGRMPPYMRGPPGQKFVVSHSTFDPVLVSCLQDFESILIKLFVRKSSKLLHV